MKTITLLFTAFCLCLMLQAKAQSSQQVVRLARIQIDSTQIEVYKAALEEEIKTSVKIEPGVITLYAVYEKSNPTKVTILEIYANDEAFKLHRESPHFKKYKSITKTMVKSLDLQEAAPIVLESKLK